MLSRSVLSVVRLFRLSISFRAHDDAVDHGKFFLKQSKKSMAEELRQRLSSIIEETDPSTVKHDTNEPSFSQAVQINTQTENTYRSARQPRSKTNACLIIALLVILVVSFFIYKNKKSHSPSRPSNPIDQDEDDADVFVNTDPLFQLF